MEQGMFTKSELLSEALSKINVACFFACIPITASNIFDVSIKKFTSMLLVCLFKANNFTFSLKATIFLTVQINNVEIFIIIVTFYWNNHKWILNEGIYFWSTASYLRNKEMLSIVDGNFFKSV